VRRRRTIAVRLRRRVLKARRYGRARGALRVRDTAVWHGVSLSSGVRRRGRRPPGCAAAAAEAGRRARGGTAVAVTADVAIHLAKRDVSLPIALRTEKRRRRRERERRTERRLARESQAPASSSMS
jgi:hypothetical protein